VTSSAGVSEVIRRGWEDVDKCEGIVTQEGRKNDVGGVIQPFRGPRRLTSCKGEETGSMSVIAVFVDRRIADRLFIIIDMCTDHGFHPIQYNLDIIYLRYLNDDEDSK